MRIGRFEIKDHRIIIHQRKKRKWKGGLRATSDEKDGGPTYYGASKSYPTFTESKFKDHGDED